MGDAPHRDRSTDRWLRQALEPARDAGPTEACLDADTLAGWMDGRLSGAALDAARTHAATCGHCQAVLATMARIEPVAGGDAAASRAPRWWMWAVPLTAAAAVVLVLVALPRNRSPLTAPVDRQPGLRDERAQPQASPPAARDEKLEETKNETAAKRQNALADKDRAARADLGKLEASKTTGAATSPSPVPAAPPSQTAAAAEERQRETVALGAQVAQRALAPADIASPDPNVRWRIRGSIIERTDDGGATWRPTSTGTTAELTAGAAPSASVCWVVGRGGTVLLSTDSRTWRRLTFPEVTDLSSVRATDAANATVATADGRTFVTSDGGQHWVRRLVLQEN